MTQSMIDESIGTLHAENDRGAPIRRDSYRRASPEARKKLEERAATSMRAEVMFGFLAEEIDYEFLEIVFGCRGRKVPKEFGL